MPVTTAPAQAARSGFTTPVPAPANHPLSPSCPESVRTSVNLSRRRCLITSHLRIFPLLPVPPPPPVTRAPPNLHDPYAGSEDADSRMTRGCERAKNESGPIIAPAAPSPLAARTSTSTLPLHAPTSTFPSMIVRGCERAEGGGRRAARAVSTGEDDGGDEQGTGGTRAARTRTPRWREAVRGYKRVESESGPAPAPGKTTRETKTISRLAASTRVPAPSLSQRSTDKDNAKTMPSGDENGTGGRYRLAASSERWALKLGIHSDLGTSRLGKGGGEAGVVSRATQTSFIVAWQWPERRGWNEGSQDAGSQAVRPAAGRRREGGSQVATSRLVIATELPGAATTQDGRRRYSVRHALVMGDTRRVGMVDSTYYAARQGITGRGRDGEIRGDSCMRARVSWWRSGTATTTARVVTTKETHGGRRGRRRRQGWRGTDRRRWCPSASASATCVGSETASQRRCGDDQRQGAQARAQWGIAVTPRPSSASRGWMAPRRTTPLAGGGGDTACGRQKRSVWQACGGRGDGWSVLMRQDRSNRASGLSPWLRVSPALPHPHGSQYSSCRAAELASRIAPTGRPKPASRG
ncbi:hypothetical protein B0H13DRAFT_2266200 [Mycena leptocephala]|nr:hypothetical protein B0H13DRAFT_2266200 [Mycena leptocephala]